MKCHKCGAEIRWSEFHEVGFLVLWDSMYSAYYNAISEIQRLIWLARKVERGDDFEDHRKEIFRLLKEIKNLAESALAKLGVEKTEKVEVAEGR
jgi:hypothetical protein